MEVPSTKSLETNRQPPFQLPTGKSYHVFISYATAQPDKQLAELLYAACMKQSLNQDDLYRIISTNICESL